MADCNDCTSCGASYVLKLEARAVTATPNNPLAKIFGGGASTARNTALVCAECGAERQAPCNTSVGVARPSFDEAKAYFKEHPGETYATLKTSWDPAGHGAKAAASRGSLDLQGNFKQLEASTPKSCSADASATFTTSGGAKNVC